MARQPPVSKEESEVVHHTTYERKTSRTRMALFIPFVDGRDGESALLLRLHDARLQLSSLAFSHSNATHPADHVGHLIT